MIKFRYRKPSLSESLGDNVDDNSEKHDKKLKSPEVMANVLLKDSKVTKIASIQYMNKKNGGVHAHAQGRTIENTQGEEIELVGGKDQELCRSLRVRNIFYTFFRHFKKKNLKKCFFDVKIFVFVDK